MLTFEIFTINSFSGSYIHYNFVMLKTHQWCRNYPSESFLAILFKCKCFFYRFHLQTSLSKQPETITRGHVVFYECHKSVSDTLLTLWDCPMWQLVWVNFPAVKEIHWKEIRIWNNSDACMNFDQGNAF